MDMKKMTAMGLALALVAGGASLGAVSTAYAGKEAPKSEAPAEKKDIKQGDKAPEAEEAKTRGFKKGQKPTETMGTMGKEKTKDGAKP
jgi:hypothetical protein